MKFYGVEFIETYKLSGYRTPQRSAWSVSRRSQRMSELWRRPTGDTFWKNGEKIDWRVRKKQIMDGTGCRGNAKESYVY